MYAPGLLPFSGAWQAYEKSGIKTARPQQFWWHVLQIIGGGHHKHRAGLILKPGQEGAKNSQSNAASILAQAGSKALLYLIYPQYTGAHGFGNLQGTPQVRLRLAKQRPEELSNIHPQQRGTPAAS